MADFALGLTKTAVEGTLSRVRSAIEEEKNIKEKVQNNLVFITGEFEMMRSFLTVANKERAKNEVVRTWVRQVRDLAFDVEDCVELVVSLDVKSVWSWLWRVLPGCVAPSRPLDDVAAMIELLKARVEDVSKRNTRYNLVTSGSGGDQPIPHTTVGSASSSSSSAAAAAIFHDLRKMWCDLGKLHHTASTGDLKKMIDCHGSKLRVISLWGSSSPQANAAAGELGWKAIVQKVYDDPSTCREFKNRAWIKPMYPFNPVEFLNTLLSHFKSHLHHHRQEDMSQLVLQVSQHKYLIVIEQELSSVADWDAIRLCLPDGKNGSRIIVSTRHLGIALACTKKPYHVLELKPFFGGQYLYAVFPEGSGYRIGMGELRWQVRHPGVISVFFENYKEYGSLMRQLEWMKWDLRILHGLEFENYKMVKLNLSYQQLKLTDLADQLLENFYPKDEQEDELQKFERCRKLLTEHYWLIYISNLKSTTDWDLIRRDLLPESTRGCIVVITHEQSVATHCVDHESRAINAKDLIKPSNLEGQRGHRGRGGRVKEEDYEFGKLVGREDVKFNVSVRRIFKEHIKVTRSMWGIAGVGKSAFVREKYYLDKIKNRSYTMYGWVDVPHPFNLTDLCRLLLLDLFSDDAEATETAAVGMLEGQDPIPWCCKILLENHFLIVLDGLESTHDWDLIEATLLSQHVRGTAIVITREESIAKHCSLSKDDILNLKGLEPSASLDLFLQKRTVPSSVAGVLNNLISKCGGFPGIIKAIADLPKLRYSAGVHEFEDVNARFMDILERDSDLRGLFCWMQFYFDACPDELKPCIFYLSVFPACQSIRRRRLLCRWIAEGYSFGGGGTANEKGEMLFSQLVKLSIVYQEQQTSTISSCKVNGFFLEYIKSRPMEDNRVFELEGSCSPSSRLMGQHLTISSSWDRDVNVFNSIDLSRLRSLTVFGVWRSFLICDKMKFLRVLDLEGTSTSDVTTSVTDDVLEQVVKLFPRLKFLSVRGCVHITCLPDSPGDMRQLETLDVRHTSIIELPPAIINKLHKLQYIRAGTSRDTSLLLLETKTSIPSPPTSTPPSSTPTRPPQEDSNGDMSNYLQDPAAARVVQLASTRTTEACKRKARDLVISSHKKWWELKNQMNLRRRHCLAANGGGIELPLAAAKGIGRLVDMHTLGVVNVAGGKGALLFLEELKKLTQLRKLGLSGINRKNWIQVCRAISGNLCHLESLSLQLMLLEEEGGSFDFACFHDMPKPPKTLKRLKVLYTSAGGRAAGGACIRLGWLMKISPLEWFQHEVTISSQEDIDAVAASGRASDPAIKRVLIKLVGEDLSFEGQEQVTYPYCARDLDSLRVECSGGPLSPAAKVTFGKMVFVHAKEISIHCCCNSSSAGTSTAAGSSSSCNLKIVGLGEVYNLKEVTVTGTYGDSLKRGLREQLDKHKNKPVLK